MDVNEKNYNVLGMAMNKKQWIPCKILMRSATAKLYLLQTGVAISIGLFPWGFDRAK